MIVMVRVMKKPAQRRFEILMAAKDLFEQQGYALTSVESIIKRAGVAKGTFYYYFKSKREILQALVVHVGQSMREEMERVASLEDLNAVEKLQQAVRGVGKQAISGSALMNTLHNVENRELQERLNVFAIADIAPVLARIVEQGNKEGCFKVAQPLEAIQLLLAGSQFVLDSGLFDWKDDKRMRLLTALQEMFERLVAAEPGQLSFIANEIENK